MSKLYFKYGAMNSGKSTILIQTAHNYESLGMKVLVMKPKTDKKGDNYVVSRIGAKRKIDYFIEDGDNLYEFIRKYHKNINCLLIDEAHFLEAKQIDELLLIAAGLDIAVICYGLRCDFKLNAFEGGARLLEIADKLEEIKTICKCGHKATINVRKVNDNYVFDGNQVAIDGFENVTYESMCPKCYFEIKNNVKNLD